MSDSDHGNVPQGCNSSGDIAVPMVEKANFDNSTTVNDSEAKSPASNGISSNGSIVRKTECDVEAGNEKEQDKLLQQQDVPSKRR